jgi:hypothetical protein
MIVLTDGQTHGSNFTYMAQTARQQKITTSTVAVGADSATQLLNTIAQAGGGKYYLVDNPNTIPRIFMKEAMRVARPVIFEEPAGISPQRVASHEILDGIDDPLPPLTGFVMTSPKDSPLVEIPLISPQPAGNRNSLLASWQYGLGRAVAFTSDAGQRWTKSWPEWPGYEKLFTQMARWTMRPTENQGSLQVFAEVENGEIQIVATALDKDDNFVNFLNLGATLLGPDREPIQVELEQTAPGRYVGRAPASQPGSYLLSVSGGPNEAPVRAGVNVPYSAEFSDRESNVRLLEELAALTPVGGKPGRVLPEPTADTSLRDALATNVFRTDLARATTRRDSWHLLALVAGCLFFCDVFNRRVVVSFSWIPALGRCLTDRLRSKQHVPQSAALERLQARKRQVGETLDQRRATARFEPLPDSTVELPAEVGAVATAEAAPQTSPQPSLAPQVEEESYTARLKKAKQQAVKGRKLPGA